MKREGEEMRALSYIRVALRCVTREPADLRGSFLWAKLVLISSQGEYTTSTVQ